MTTLSTKQVESIRDATAPVNIWHGSVRSGKSLASAIAFAHDLTRPKTVHGARDVIIGRTVDTIYRNVITTLRELLGDDAVLYTRGANTAVILGTEVDIIGASDAKAEGRIRGMTVRLAYVDEASLLPGEGFWQSLLDRQMTVADKRTYATTNPDNPNHWLKINVIDRAEALGFNAWHFVLDDNPILTSEAKAQAALRNTGLFYQRNILGLWVLAEGAIYDMWDADAMVSHDVPEVRSWMVAIDYGTASVFAALLIGEGTDGRLWVAAEWRHDAKAEQRQLTDVEYAEAIRGWLDDLDPASNDVASVAPGARRPWRIVVDPSASSFITQLHRAGMSPHLADNTVADGIRSVASLMSADRLRVHPRCTGLLGEIPGYVWDPKAALIGEDKPVKAADHSCDALRYGVRGTWQWWRRWLDAP